MNRNTVSYYLEKLRRITDIKHLCILVKGIVYIMRDRIHGVDFSTIEPISEEYRKGELLNSYIYSSPAAIESAMDHLKVGDGSAFLDIGCGKGLVLYAASKRHFSRIAGLEIDSHLAEVAVHNFQKLNMEKRVEIFNCDARNFERYGEFDVFYFFNPFSIEIQNQIVRKIISQRIPDHTRATWLLCYHDCASAYIEQTGCFCLVDQYKDEERGHIVTVWKSVLNPNGKDVVFC